MKKIIFGLLAYELGANFYNYFAREKNIITNDNGGKVEKTLFTVTRLDSIVGGLINPKKD